MQPSFLVTLLKLVFRGTSRTPHRLSKWWVVGSHYICMMMSPCLFCINQFSSIWCMRLNMNYFRHDSDQTGPEGQPCEGYGFMTNNWDQWQKRLGRDGTNAPEIITIGLNLKLARWGWSVCSNYNLTKNYRESLYKCVKVPGKYVSVLMRVIY